MPPSNLPIIDISPFLPHTSSTILQKQHCAKKLADACQNTGFFYLTDHGIPTCQTDEILNLARQFFHQASDDEKADIARQDAGVDAGDGGRGWQRMGDNVTEGRRDWHEAVDFYPEVTAEGPPYKPLMGPNKWPRTPHALRKTYEIYVEKMLELGTATVRAMGFALDPENEDVFVDQTRNSFWVMRMIGYPRLPESTLQDGVSCGAHTDYGCVTLLLADETKGALQVQAKDGSWITADPVPGAYVVNIGDMVERWTNGLWKSTRHRVVHKGDGYRVSVPFFFEPDLETRVKPLESCIEITGKQELYGEVIYGDHLLGKVLGNFYGGGGGQTNQDPRQPSVAL
ncbi:MAG: hypothetical protein M1827_007681 [Pycnora praestabilis]|nr:MAG: hypothetical protein M1827_007681 [Pycnora praestabilis]